MTIWYVLIVITINVVIILLWEIVKRRKIANSLKQIADVQSLIEKENYSEALEMLSKLEKRFPSIVFQMMGDCYYGLGNKEKAYELYRKSLSLDETMDLSYWGLLE